MKKRVLSMFMALALCLTLLPAPAFAEGTEIAESGAAQVTTADNKEQVYGTFDKAWSAAIKSEGSTLKLLSDVELSNEVGQDGLPVSEGSFTLDLNNKTLQGAIWNQLLEVSGTANITIKNGSLVNTQTGPAASATSTNFVALKISGGTVALDKVNLTSGSNTEGKHSSALYITGGSLTVTGSTFTGEVGVLCENSGTRPALSIADATLNNGIFYWVAGAQASDTAGLEAIFADGSMLFDQNSKYIDLASKDYWHIDIENVVAIFLYTEKCIVKPHTHEKIDLANAEVTIDPWPADGKCIFVPNASETFVFSVFSTITVTANGEKYKLSDGDYIYTGATATRVGKYTLTIKATDSCAKFKGSKAIPWEVIPYTLYEPSFLGKQTYTKTYDGTTTLPEYTFRALFPGKGSDSEVDWREDKYKNNYEVTAAEFVSADAGENKPINQTITLKNENFVFAPTEMINIKGITTTDKTITYTNFTPIETYPTLGTTFNIEKATMPDFDKEVTLDIVNNHADTYTVDLSALLPKLESPRTYGEIKYSQPTVQLAFGYYTDGHAKVENGKLILTIDKNPVTTTGSIGTVAVEVKSTNYKPVTLTVNLRSVNKRKLGMFVSLATDPVVYGMTLGDIKLSAEATVDKQVIPGTIAWEDPLTTVPAAGRATYRWTFTPDDTMHYLTASNTINFLVDKATPTGAPTYTAITTGGKTLADAPLTPNASWPSGTVQWVDKDGKPLPASTQVQANTEYTWSFTPADAANYNGATGSVTLYAVSSGGGGGGGSSSASKTSTTTNADGSVTKTETKSDGTVVETTTGKDGSTTKTETKKDGSSVTETKAADGSTGTVKTDKNGNTEAETKVSAKAVEDAKKNGEPVKAPVEVKASRDSSTAPTVKVELPKNSGETKVEIPVSNVKPGTVAVLVHADGTEEIVKNSLPTEDGIQLTVNGGATVKIVDNSKDFADTRNHWAKDAIDFVSARGLVNGMNDSIYAPDASTTRAQLWTILARQNDADLNGGNTWYEKAQLWSKDKGVSDGANPNGTIDRAQMVTMLWRAAGQPTAGGTANFTDVPADSYYANAVSWAVEGGITDGVGGGRFDPTATCTRAQIVTFLYRSYQSK